MSYPWLDGHPALTSALRAERRRAQIQLIRTLHGRTGYAGYKLMHVQNPTRAVRLAVDDPLLWREVILRREGHETLVNMIRGAHNLPNKY